MSNETNETRFEAIQPGSEGSGRSNLIDEFLDTASKQFVPGNEYVNEAVPEHTATSGLLKGTQDGPHYEIDRDAISRMKADADPQLQKTAEFLSLNYDTLRNYRTDDQVSGISKTDIDALGATNHNSGNWLGKAEGIGIGIVGSGVGAGLGALAGSLASAGMGKLGGGLFKVGGTLIGGIAGAAPGAGIYSLFNSKEQDIDKLKLPESE